MSAISAILSSQWAQLAFVCVAFGLVYGLRNALHTHDKSRAEFWTKLDTVGLPGSTLFPWTRALLWSLTSLRQNVHEGYKAISKARGLPFALPTVWKDGAVVVLPPDYLHLLNRPEREVKAYFAQLETIQLPYMFDDDQIYTNATHFDVVRKHMINGKDVDALASATCEEIDVALGDIWGISEQWTEVNTWDVCGRIITRAATRTLYGLPLCRDELLFEESRLFADCVMSGTVLLNCLPPLVRPVIGPLVAWRAKHYRNRCLRLLVPFVKRRLKSWKEGKEQDEQPNDFLQWMIIKGLKEAPEQLQPARLANRLLALNVMFVIAMAYIFSHAVLDIYGSPSKAEIVLALEEECGRVSSQHGGDLSTKAAVDDLHRVDSAIRESMRVSDVAVTALARDVESRSLDLGNGVHIPPGVRIVYPTQAIHQDPDYYPNPMQFDPFRFSRHKEESEVDAAAPSGDERETLTSITPSFLAFGYGRHACPGRWFAAQTMKQALAAVLMNYDVEVLRKPQRRTALLNMMIPATGARLRVRRRQPC